MSQSLPGPGQRGAVAVVVRRGRLLVIRRSRQVIAPGAFCLPGGGIKPDESEQEALVREVQEELSVLIRPVRRLWQSVTAWNVHLSWWLGDLEPDMVPLPNLTEVESVHWLTPAEMLRLPDLLGSNREFLEALARGQIDLVI